MLPDSFLGVTLILSAFAAAQLLKPGEETNSLTAFVVLSSVSFFHSSFDSLLLSGVLWKEEGKVSDSDGGDCRIPLMPEKETLNKKLIYWFHFTFEIMLFKRDQKSTS